MLSLDDALASADAAFRENGWVLEGLPVPMATVHLVGSADTGITMGGLVTWLLNSSGRYASETIHAYARIGAVKSAALLAQAVALVGPGGIPADDAQRAAVITALPDATIAAIYDLGHRMLDYPDDVGALLEAYVAEHDAALMPRWRS